MNVKIPALFLYFGLLLLCLFGISQKSYAQLFSTVEYIDSFKYIAMQEMRAYGVPASITLGQGVLESASGNSKLAKNCNNHFGIKCKNAWTGKSCLADDDAKDECFRGYESAFDSYRDHSVFLKNSNRYATLFGLSATDYKSWANGLREAGYATNPIYGTILIGVIEKYHLGKLDSIVVFGEDFFAANPAVSFPIPVNGIEAVLLRAGETPMDIADRYNLKIGQIYKYNDIQAGQMLNPGEIIYLKPKRKYGLESSHVVKSGENMRDISQRYGMKMKHLYTLNRLESGQEAKVGEVLNLQQKRVIAPLLDSPSVGIQNSVNAVDLILKKSNFDKPLNEGSVSVENLRNVGNVYEVQEGETLAQIALNTHVSILDLTRWNNIDGENLAVGQLLVLTPNIKISKETQVEYNRFTQDNTEPEHPNKIANEGIPSLHTVRKGETVYSISKDNGIPLDSLVGWNNLLGKPLQIGRSLYLQNPVNYKISRESPMQRYHFVQPGETLFALSRKYSVRVETIQKWNNMGGNQIEVGRRLRVRE